MKIAVCDDEIIFQRQLMAFLNDYYKSLDVVIETFSSGEELLQEYRSGQFYDLLFLDIELGGLDGIATAQKIREYDSKGMVVFLTSHTEFAMEGYEVSAIRFLSKPIMETKLLETLREINNRIQQRKKLILHINSEDIVIDLENIIYMESMRNDVYLYVMMGNRKEERLEEIKVRKRITELDEELNENQFYRCHRSYIINLDYVISYNKNKVKMKMDKMIPVSRGKEKELRDKIICNIRKRGI
ncbi:LytR/AlgR family response regulator transcription factor [Marinisporobacter balticus]|uniref:Stage 0 sporulation protein A homolog n=1 Tax=Marinisporobacter balticus TaxID=2018667 RepID=A0A4R2KN34_9FIRM|nr:LytTR family DNA-binding domain-containing protein [Marinisporobacter balticus]TCO72189.1 LytTR family two component transcriptional regulator [Marinisporobacter balticus]